MQTDHCKCNLTDIIAGRPELLLTDLMRLLPTKQLNIKVQGGIWWNDTASPPLAVAQICRNDQASLATFLHSSTVTSQPPNAVQS